MTLFERLIPLYLIVAMGILAGKKLAIDRESIAKLAIYIISPVVVFTSVSQLELRPEYLAVPFGLLLVCSAIALLFLWAAPCEGRMNNLLAFAAGDANTGYFGLPVALMLFGPEWSGLYLLFCLGFILYENSVGFYILARGSATPREAALRLAKLPALHAFVAALAANAAGLKIGGVYADFAGFFRGAYSVLGTLLIGLGVSRLEGLRVDVKFLSYSFLAKFAVWPTLALGFVLLDRSHLYFYDDRVHRMLVLIACTPLAANTVAFATLLKVEPQKAGIAVLASTLFALFFLPAFYALVFA